MKRLSTLLHSGVAAALLALGCAQAMAQEVLLAMDTRLNRVMTLDPFSGAVLNPNFITDAGPSGLYDFQTPRAAIQVNNEIWVTDQGPNANAIFRFDHEGGFLGCSGGNTAGGGTIGAQPWDVISFGGGLLVSDGTSRALQQYSLEGTYTGALTTAFNNIPQQMQLRANGNILASANGSQPLASFGLYAFSSTGTQLASWTGTPGLGVHGVYELGNGQYLISESGGLNAERGLGTIDPAGAQNNSNFSLILGSVNGGWISPAVLTPVPEPASLALMAGGLLLSGVRRRAQARASSARIAPITAA